MKTKKYFYLTGLLTIAASCYNERDLFPAFDDDCNWETTLNDIISDNEKLFDARGFKIVDMEILEDMVLDSTLFFDEINGYFPVYSKTDSTLKVMSYNEIEESKDANDTRFLKIRNKINDLISNQDDYYCVQLTWQYGEDRFNTLALFNKRTGELEYDNMLFNMTTISKYDKSHFSRFLRESELQYLVSEYDEATYYNDGRSLVAFAGFYYVIYGHWSTYQVIVEEDGHKYLDTHYTFVLDNVITGEENYATSGYDYKNYNANYSVLLQPRYEIKYALWAGPINGFNLSVPFNLALADETEVAERTIEGNYAFQDIKVSPHREMTRVMIE